MELELQVEVAGHAMTSETRKERQDFCVALLHVLSHDGAHHRVAQAPPPDSFLGGGARDTSKMISISNLGHTVAVCGSAPALDSDTGMPR